MHKPLVIEERTPVWLALSEFYLDTELQESDLKYLAEIFLNSPYTLEEIKTINKYEVFPVLQPNLLKTDGQWTGFEEEWLIETITTKLNTKNQFSHLVVEANYSIYKWMCKDYWEHIERIYEEFKNEPDKNKG